MDVRNPSAWEVPPMLTNRFVSGIVSAPIFLFLFILLSVPSAATTFYFSTSGSDANDGLSSSTPKQSIAAANALMSGGNTILFKRGDIWYIPLKSVILDNRSNFTLDAYGTGALPVIAGMALIDDTWTYEGNNVWSNPTVYGEAFRVFVNNVSRISLHDKANNNPVVSDLDAVDEYLYDIATKKLYIYHASAETPPENVVMLPAWPAPPLVSMLNTTNVTIRNIEFWGGGNVSTIRIYAPSSNILIDKCVVTRSNQIGIFAINNKQNMNVVENLVIQDCIIDKAWTQAENNLKPEVKLDGDGVAFMHGVRNSVVRNCKITNWGHDGISVIATEYTTGIYGVKYNKFEGNDISAGNSAYMHAFGVLGFKDLAMYNIFKGNYCHGFSSANSVGGNTNFIFSNIFANVTVSPLPQHSQAPHAINIATWTIKDKNGISGTVESRNNWIVNNTIYNTDTYAFRLDRSNTDGDVTSLMNNKIYNNLLLNYGLDTTYKTDPQNPTPPLRLGLRILTNVSSGVTAFRNNNFWVEWDTLGIRPVALYKKSSYSAAQLTNCAECGADNVSDNTQMNPHLGAFYELTPGSGATLTTGGYLYKQAIVAAGLPSEEFVDYYGKAWLEPGISVGAIQYYQKKDCDGITDDGEKIIFYRDADGDTFGDPDNLVNACSAPEGYVTNGDDFDDTDATRFPGATEVCNGKDDNGNGEVDEGVKSIFYADADGDNYGDPNNTVSACSAPEGYVTNGDDFDDTDATRFPGAIEVCNGKDDNGNGEVDEGVKSIFYADVDGDTFGDPENTLSACSAPEGYVTNGDDFDDTDATRYPGATEVCNGRDDNGNGEIDEGVKSIFYADADGDNYGDPNSTVSACSAPEGYVTNSDDFDDTDATRYPGATEICNSKDDNGNGQIDEGVTTTYYLDNDGDGYGSSVTVNACSAPAKYVTNNSDCNDNNSSVHPNATEVCNGIDDDCDGQIDEGVKTTFYFDKDGDGYGDRNVPIQACAAPAGYVSNSNDCNDNASSINPGSTEICTNAIDDNCNGSVNEGCAPVTLPAITINDLSVKEHNSGTRNASFTLTLSKLSAVPVTVKYVTVSKTANTSDYTHTSGTATFAANSLTAKINVPVKGDIYDEYDENFHVVLSSPTNATISKTTGICTITDDDQPPSMSVSDVSATENSQLAVVKVSLNVISGKAMTVNFDTRNGTAVAPGDYTSQLNGTVSFGSGVKEQFINIVIKKDSINEPTEKFTVVLKPTSATAAVISRGTATVSILNSSVVVSKTATIDPPAESEPLTINAFPNPALSQFKLKLTGGEGLLTILVTDAFGRPVEKRTSVQTNSTLSIGAGWKPGTYMMEVFDKKQKFVLKLLKVE